MTDTTPDLTCQNCGGVGDDRLGPVRTLSMDLDLPTVALCGLCAFAIVHDHDLFDDLAKEARDGR